MSPLNLSKKVRSGLIGLLIFAFPAFAMAQPANFQVPANDSHRRQPEVAVQDAQERGVPSPSQHKARGNEEVESSALSKVEKKASAEPALDEAKTPDSNRAKKETEIVFGAGTVNVIYSKEKAQWVAEVRGKDQVLQQFVLQDFSVKQNGNLLVKTQSGKEIEFSTKGRCTVFEDLVSASSGHLAYSGMFVLKALKGRVGDKTVQTGERLVAESASFLRVAETGDDGKGYDSNSVQRVYFEHDQAGTLRGSTLIRKMVDGSKVTYVMKSEEGANTYKVWVAKSKNQWPHKYEFAHKPILESEKNTGVVIAISGFDADGRPVSILMNGSGVEVKEGKEIS